MSNKKRAIVICPGRGTYNKEELGYLTRYHANKQAMIDVIDADRKARNQLTIAELDGAEKYNMRQHTAGENASSLIYACARGDFLDINRDEYDIVAVTGNSMGWYIACAVAGAINHENGAKLINTMGSMMTNGLIGGQAIYPIVDDNWQHCPERFALVLNAIEIINQQAECELYASIQLGGYMVFGGNEAALKALAQHLPELENRYPMRLFNHAAFHTPLMNDIANKGQQQLSKNLFGAPDIPLIDGEGTIWQPHSTEVSDLYDYTLGTQVRETYNFSKAIEVSIKEFAPDALIITGPGATLGGAVAQTLIAHNWYDLTDKASFIERQKADPVILAMGMEAQRKIVC
ncbi:ACP S-malonyltransferase [Planctobacterium marinum]|uniref:[acyl-carrier-protein] S-malonyltransferase n=1 Tax=Planctobacterium marinum TaxID=1631968 RepID=A0AA48KW53_9ALTE|nr:acyl carrier protein [Planctobacterium marinum]